MMKKSLILILAILVQTLSAQPRQYLHDGWTFGQARKANRYEAKVPGVVHTDLLRHHLIDDPYIGLNERSKLLATITNSVTIPAYTSTRLLKLPIQQLLNGQQRENVVISMQFTTRLTADELKRKLETNSLKTFRNNYF